MRPHKPCNILVVVVVRQSRHPVLSSHGRPSRHTEGRRRTRDHPSIFTRILARRADEWIDVVKDRFYRHVLLLTGEKGLRERGECPGQHSELTRGIG